MTSPDPVSRLRSRLNEIAPISSWGRNPGYDSWCRALEALSGDTVRVLYGQSPVAFSVLFKMGVEEDDIVAVFMLTIASNLNHER